MRFLFLLAGLLLAAPAWGQAPPKAADVGKSYQVPYKLTDTGHVLVRTKINGKGPYNFIIDTGAPILIVNVKVGKELGLSEDKTGWAVLDRFEIEGGVINSKFRAKVLTPFQLEGMNAMNFAGAELHGIIGFTLLAQYRMEFDFSTPKMRWTRLDFSPPPPEAVKVKDAGQDGLNAMASIMKAMSFLLGKKENPQLVPQGFLGLELAEQDGAVRIAHVWTGSPAADAGLKKGDRLLEVGGDRIGSLADVARVTKAFRPGGTLSLTLNRNEKELKLSVTAGKGL
jgi:hypothetical protein